MRLLVSSDVSAAKFLHQDADDADEQDEVDLVETKSNMCNNKMTLHVMSHSEIDNSVSGTSYR